MKLNFKLLALGAVVFVAGMIALGGVHMVFSKTNEMEFCTSCHGMKVSLEEYKETSHYKNRTGVQAECSDCHVPKSFFPKVMKKMMAAKDVYHDILGTIALDDSYLSRRGENGHCDPGFIPVEEGSKYCVPSYKGETYSEEDMSEEAEEAREKAIKRYEAYRWTMANAVWDYMRENDSRECRSCHAFENMDPELQDRSAKKKHATAEEKGKTCIDCHKGIAHVEPEEPEEEDEEEDEEEEV